MYILPYKQLNFLFEQATQKILDNKWTEFSILTDWQEVLPYPDLSALPTYPLAYSTFKLIGVKDTTERELQLQWQIRATEFFNLYNECINKNIYEIKRHLSDQLHTWNYHHPTKGEQLLPDQIYREWFNTVKNLSLTEFSRLHIWAGTAQQFLEPKYQELKRVYDMKIEQEVQPSIQNTGKLTYRQIALLYIYQDKQIKSNNATKIAQQYGQRSGDKLCMYYNNNSRRNDRTGVEGRQIKPLLNDLAVVIPLLENQYRRTAEDEQKTISAKNRA